MQFTSNIIVALLLLVAVSTSPVAAVQKWANLRGGQELQEQKEVTLINDDVDSSHLDLERSLLDGCPGLDYPYSAAAGYDCPYLTCDSSTQTKCWSLWNQNCYCQPK